VAAVHWALGARQELGTLIVQLGRYSPTYAASFAGRVLAAVERLEDFPRSGRIVPDYQDDTVRELVIDGYRLVYLFEFEEVEVVAILHGSRDVVARLGDDPRERR
jgi:toxin ParE1/3/4